MQPEPWNFVGRKPRHHVADASQASVRLDCNGSDYGESPPTELIDFARNGAQLRISGGAQSACPAAGEKVVLELRSQQAGLDIRLPGTIRWQHAEGPGQWLVGCEFDEEVSLETLGELFLNEILSAGHSEPDESPLAVEPQRPQG
ncbi:MAG TPA: PilZ domain-containing protein [Pirellulales bacterium]|nr:PilZ domain-containing protein [Pirellulales bacterium]